MKSTAIYMLPLVLATTLAAQQAPIPSYKELKFPPLREVRIPDVAAYTLPNGMKLYLVENHELPLLSGFALIRTGNLFDPPDKVGLAGLTGTVLRSGGTRNRTGDQLDEQLENIAASVESGIGETSGQVSFSALRENADEVLAVFKDLLTEPEFRQEKLDLAKSQLRSSISRRNDEASDIASREFSDIVYGKDTPYGWRIEYEHVDRIQREDLVAFYKRYFFPTNVMLAVYGDFSSAEMKAKIEKLFGGWTVRQAQVPPFPSVREKAASGVYLASKEDVTQTFFQMGHLGGLLRDKNYPALDVMADILGGGFRSRLFRKVRTELGYAYSVHADWGANYNHPGTFVIGGSTKSASTVDTLRVIKEEIDRLRSGEVSDEELKTAKDKVLNSFVFNFDTPAKTLSRLISYEYHGYPRDFIFQYQKGVAAVTRADVLRVAREYLKPEAMTVVAVGKPADFGKPLTELGMAVVPVDLTIPQPKQPTAKTDAASLEGGRKLLQKVQAAMGGAEKLASVKDLTAVTTLEIQASGGGMKARKTERWVSPASLRQDQDLPFGKVTAYFDGNQGWLATPQGTSTLTGPLLDQQRGALFRYLVPLVLSDRARNRMVNLAADGTLEISDPAGSMTRLTVDARTGLPAAQVYRMPGAGGAPSEVKEIYSDWRDVNGVRFPFKIEIHQGGGRAVSVAVEEIRVNTGISVEELSRKP